MSVTMRVSATSKHRFPPSAASLEVALEVHLEVGVEVGQLPMRANPTTMRVSATSKHRFPPSAASLEVALEVGVEVKQLLKIANPATTRVSVTSKLTESAPLEVLRRCGNSKKTGPRSLKTQGQTFLNRFRQDTVSRSVVAGRRGWLNQMEISSLGIFPVERG